MFVSVAHLRSVTLELKLNNETTGDAAPCQPRLQQYFCWWQFFFVNIYSIRKLFTGLAKAAFIICALIVSNTIKVIKNPAIAKSHQFILVRSAKFCNHLFMLRNASGVVMIKANNTSNRKSLDTSAIICKTDAPKILRTPISFVR